jgi:flavin reductase (DIM6/NTAB) family NADH-FMN oxidoreductase RutF
MVSTMKKTLQVNDLSAGTVGSVVMVTCVKSEKNANIITIGMYMPISHDPRLVCIGVSPKRYSHHLIAESGEFVVNIPSLDLEEEIVFCGTKSGREVDKFIETGLTPIPAKMVNPPLIKECFGHLECKVVQTYTCGDHTLFVGKVVAASVDEDVLTEGNLDLIKAKPIVQKNHVYYTVIDKK